jgi:multidrug efflux pump
MEQLANNLPSGTTWAWSGLSLQEKLASGQAMSLYALSILDGFLILLCSEFVICVLEIQSG